MASVRNDMVSFEALRQDAARTLTQAGIDNAATDVRLLLCAATGFSSADLIVHAHDPVPCEVHEKLQALLARRQTHTPIAQILGTQEFWSLNFKVTPDVLVPRPDTEVLVERTLEILTGVTAPKILDVGTGTGAILISLLHERPDAHGVGVDISTAALEVARANANQNGVADRAAFERSDFLKDVNGPFDIVVANPPYITDAAMQTLPKTVAAYEPHLALRGGADGLTAYRAIIDDLARVLKPGGHVVFEIGYDQKTTVTELLTNIAAGDITCLQDLAGHDRVISAKINEN